MVSSQQKSKGDSKSKRVRKSCLACRKSHVRCEATRPCRRCLSKGIECVDEDDQFTRAGYHAKVVYVKADGSTVEGSTSSNDIDSEHSLSPQKQNRLSNLDHSVQDVKHQNENLKQELETLKFISQSQQKMIAQLYSQVEQQNRELMLLRYKQLARTPDGQQILKFGQYDDFALSTYHAVGVFQNDDSNTLLGFNATFCNFLSLDPDQLQNTRTDFLALGCGGRSAKDPALILQMVKRKPQQNISFSCALFYGGQEYPVHVNIHVEDSIWWMVIDGNRIVHNRPLNFYMNTYAALPSGFECRSPHNCVQLDENGEVRHTPQFAPPRPNSIQTPSSTPFMYNIPNNPNMNTFTPVETNQQIRTPTSSSGGGNDEDFETYLISGS